MKNRQNYDIEVNGVYKGCCSINKNLSLFSQLWLLANLALVKPITASDDEVIEAIQLVAPDNFRLCCSIGDGCFITELGSTLVRFWKGAVIQ